jgi:hypothetical protein
VIGYDIITKTQHHLKPKNDNNPVRLRCSLSFAAGSRVGTDGASFTGVDRVLTEDDKDNSLMVVWERVASSLRFFTLSNIDEKRLETEGLRLRREDRDLVRVDSGGEATVAFEKVRRCLEAEKVASSWAK